MLEYGVRNKREEFRNCHFILSRFFVQDDQGWQGRLILTLWDNVCLPVKAGSGQVSNYYEEIHEDVWENGPLQVCHESHGQEDQD